jgi:chromosome segregation protein
VPLRDASRAGASEAIVTVTFDLENDDEAAAEVKIVDISDLSPAPPKERLASELIVTRRLRVNAQGGYTSNYSINGEACNLAELHDQLNALRIYPEGYNVVLQGCVFPVSCRNLLGSTSKISGLSRLDRM